MRLITQYPLTFLVASLVFASPFAVLSAQSLSTSGEVLEQYPIEAAIDGDVKTYTRHKAPSSDNQCIDYTLTFKRPKTINAVRFIQHPDSYATHYRIWAKSESGTGDFDKLLVEVDDRRALAGDWIEHRFEPIEVIAVKFESLSGFAEQSSGYPSFGEFCADYYDEPLPKNNTTIEASVELDSKLMINGISNIHDTMFSISNVISNREYMLKYIKPLNLGVVSFWLEDYMIKLEVPEDPNHSGMFDRSFFDSEAFTDAFEQRRQRLDIVREVGAFANLALVKAPDYMRKKEFSSAANGRYKDETQFIPPESPEEWGRLVGYTIRAINRQTNGVIQWAYIWNEPNTERYLPVAWDAKADTYINLFKGAVPEIKRLNPDIKIGGPVLSGGGVLGWAKDDITDYWNTWTKRFIDECGGLADHFDAHYYNVDANCMRSEVNLLANYSYNQSGRVLPVVGSEGNYLLRVKDGNVDTLAGRWRNVACNFADLLLHALDMPEKVESLSYYYISGWFGLISGKETTPIYSFFYLIRNLRGERLHAFCANNDINIIASRNGDLMNCFIQNKSGKARRLNLNLQGECNRDEVTVESLICDDVSGQVILINEKVEVRDGSAIIDLEPYGMYSVLLDNYDNSSGKIRLYSSDDFYGDSVFKPLPEYGDVSINIDADFDRNQCQDAVLKLSLAGIPGLRPRAYEDIRVPIKICVNEYETTIMASNYNEIPVPNEYIKNRNTVNICRKHGMSSSRNVGDATPLWVLSASLCLTQVISSDVIK